MPKNYCEARIECLTKAVNVLETSLEAKFQEGRLLFDPKPSDSIPYVLITFAREFIDEAVKNGDTLEGFQSLAKASSVCGAIKTLLE